MSAGYEQLIAAGRQARNAGRLKDAGQFYADAAVVAADDVQRAHALRHVSDIASDLGYFESALIAGKEALALYRQTAGRQDLDLANALRVVARALQGSGRAEEAVEAWREARGLYTAVGVSEGVRECDRYVA